MNKLYLIYCVSHYILILQDFIGNNNSYDEIFWVKDKNTNIPDTEEREGINYLIFCLEVNVGIKIEISQTLKKGKVLITCFSVWM